MCPEPLPTAFDRYRAIVDDWQAFTDAARRPLPPVVAVNSARTDAGTFVRLLVDDAVGCRPLAWTAGAWRIDGGPGIGRRWWHLAGIGHLQEEASLLPVELLDPRPGERILDLCAAPGGKSAHIAMRVGMSGTVVANDVLIDRSRALRANLERLALANVSTTRHDGANWPLAAGAFDAVLVDAPCSGEGTLRKHDPRRLGRGPAPHLRYNALQQALLRRAFAVCRPGGRIVYSTCAFAPEENEAVVDAVLGHSAGALQVRAAMIDGLLAAPGLERWQGRVFDPSLRHAVRLWPHLNDTGGFFAVLLEKAADARGPQGDGAEPEEIEADDLRDALVMRFGVDADRLRPWLACRRSGRGCYLVNRAHRPPARPQPEASGLPVFRTGTRYRKLTTAGCALFGPHATRHVVELAGDDLQQYVEGRPLAVPGAAGAGPGHVIVRHAGIGIGIGRLAAGSATLESLFPASRAPRGSAPPAPDRRP